MIVIIKIHQTGGEKRKNKWKRKGKWTTEWNKKGDEWNTKKRSKWELRLPCHHSDCCIWTREKKIALILLTLVIFIFPGFTLLHLIATGVSCFLGAGLLSFLVYVYCQRFHKPSQESAVIHPTTPNHLNYKGNTTPKNEKYTPMEFKVTSPVTSDAVSWHFFHRATVSLYCQENTLQNMPFIQRMCVKIIRFIEICLKGARPFFAFRAASILPGILSSVFWAIFGGELIQSSSSKRLTIVFNCLDYSFPQRQTSM